MKHIPYKGVEYEIIITEIVKYLRIKGSTPICKIVFSFDKIVPPPIILHHLMYTTVTDSAASES